MKRSSKPTRIFIVSLCSILIGILLVVGIITVDYRCRNQAFGDKTPPFAIEKKSEGELLLKINTLGTNAVVNISKTAEIWEEVKVFLADSKP